MVDLLVNPLQRARVGGPEELPVADFRDLLERGGVERRDFHVLHLTKEIALAGRHPGVAVAARADGVDLRADGFGGFGGGRGRDFARVVFAVGQEDDDPALGGLVAPEPVGGGGDGAADGRAVVFGEPDLHAVHVLQEPRVVERERADEVGPSREGDDAEAVVGPRLNECLSHFFDHVDAACGLGSDGEVLGFHGAGDVEHEHDVDAARFHLVHGLPFLRARQRDDQERQGEEEEAREKVPRAALHPLAQGTEGVRAGKDDRGRAARLPAQEREERDQRQQQEHPRMDERDAEIVERVHAERPPFTNRRACSRSASLSAALAWARANLIKSTLSRNAASSDLSPSVNRGLAAAAARNSGEV